MKVSLFIVLASIANAVAYGGRTSGWNPKNPYSHWRKNSHKHGLEIDLGYEKYVGEGDRKTSVAKWKGIRFAAPPTGKNRFQAPKVPLVNRSEILPATEYPTQCVQGTGIESGLEDCLYLNVYAPQQAHGLPVMVFIHGGAYQIGSGALDSVDLIVNNDYRFIVVLIQYRLGIFGFVSSEQIKKYGQLNAGLLDMELSLKWVKNYIHLFGGDADRVTIAGESAGAGAVMLFSMLYGGTIGTSLFEQGIAASPYLPRQYNYDDDTPMSFYNQVLNITDCDQKLGDKARFDCLVKLDAVTLSAAGSQVDGVDADFTHGFAPVTDGHIIRDIPSRQLRPGRVNGKRMLAGNNANEGVIFAPRDIVTSEDSDNYISKYFTGFNARDTIELKKAYPPSEDTKSSTKEFSTTGTSPPTALNFSDWSNGEQQRVFNLQAEAILNCPAYWLADSYPHNGWKYEFAVPPAYHSLDVQAYFYSDGDHPFFTEDFVVAFQNIWGNFIVHGDPRISFDLACGSNCHRKPTHATDLVKSWKPYNHLAEQPVHLSVNVTGGTPGECGLVFVGDAACSLGPDVKNDFRVANADTWEGGRGNRCDFWRKVGSRVPA